MKLFETIEVEAAKQHAISGGQALHMMTGAWGQCITGPACFQRSREFAHLFDQDVERLKQTARSLGVRVISVQYPGTEKQHIDLCGKPLKQAKTLAAREAENTACPRCGGDGWYYQNYADQMDDKPTRCDCPSEREAEKGKK